MILAFVVISIFCVLSMMYRFEGPGLRAWMKSNNISLVKDYSNVIESDTKMHRRKQMSLMDLKMTAQLALKTCMCTSRKTDGPSESPYLVPNYLHLIVSYGDPPLTLAEAACLKSILIHQKPDTVYIHTMAMDLSMLGVYWKTLYKGLLTVIFLRQHYLLRQAPEAG